ncbi:hypothetical protein KUV80_10810 [Fictibacillus nanhaiensis]|uniref:DUF5412 family protein n=1 Tax=Fictibacillus nanhaiensis TaxID=742169 RepID=UPI001C952E38|nr:hypothetical protein [Fictibacillus nanhaiensis]MBY6037150.1 hypothetical protein [Fictibacillus nanhaiensis]
MKNKWFFRLKTVLMAAIVLIGIFLLSGSYLLNKLFDDMCGNEIAQKLASPNGDKVAFIFQRDCGATTGISYQLSLIDADEKLPNKSGNTFVSDKEFQIKWINNKKLLVNYKKSSKTYEMDKSVDWNKIQYVGR